MRRISALVVGTVQGVRPRPFVRHVALARGLSGPVRNSLGGVRIEAQGPAPDAGVRDVALAGGCFQNARLAASVATRIEAAGHTVWTSRELSPGDGGLAVGQALLAARRFEHVSRGPG